MKAEYFLDTNVLIYAATTKSREPLRNPRALELVERTAFGTSGQVLAEFYFNVVERARAPLSPRQALEWVERIALQPCVSVDAALVKVAIARSARYRISYWDGAIVAAAEMLDATTLYTEDLNHGQMYGSVRVENPFLNI